jgi:methyltransferase (TIGR00027 family)
LPKSEVARTAVFVAAVRAREQERPDHLFQDELSSVLAGPEGIAWLAASETNPASNYHRDSFPFIEVRTRFFDDWALEAVMDGGVRQFVILGAGMDTRAFRLSWPPGLRLWEIDTPELFAIKEARLQSAGAKATCERFVVEADLASSSWPGSLIDQGLKRTEPTVWVAEGLFQYLAASDVNRILEGAASLSPRASRFGAEIISEEYLRRPSKRSTLEARKDRGTPWVFGTNHPGALFGAHGWSLQGSVSAIEEAVSLGRWSQRRAGRSVVGPPGACFVSATRTTRRDSPRPKTA